MRETSTDRAAIANLIMRDLPHGFGKQRLRARTLRIPLDIAPAHEGAELDAIRSNVDPLQLCSRPISTRLSGAASRKASIGIRLWPPARTLASPRCWPGRQCFVQQFWRQISKGASSPINKEGVCKIRQSSPLNRTQPNRSWSSESSFPSLRRNNCNRSSTSSTPAPPR